MKTENLPLVIAVWRTSLPLLRLLLAEWSERMGGQQLEIMITNNCSEKFCYGVVPGRKWGFQFCLSGVFLLYFLR